MALGDSYTIGTSVRAQDRWPNQLVRALEPEFDLRLIDNLAVHGSTSAELIEAQLPQVAGLDVELVSVQIGVNDVVGGVSVDDYRDNVATILDELRRRRPQPDIVVVSTPDYTLGPRGDEWGDTGRQSRRISRFNEVMADEAGDRDLAFVEISPVASRVPHDRSLLAADDLHPSSKQYAGWVELIAPVVRGMLEKRAGH